MSAEQVAELAAKGRAAQAINALETSYSTLQRLLGPAAEPWAGGQEKVSLYVFNDAKTYLGAKNSKIGGVDLNKLVDASLVKSAVNRGLDK